MGHILAWINVEVNWMLLEVSRSHDTKSLSILHRDDVPLSEMEVVIISLWTQSKVLASYELFTGLSLINNVTPCSSWEVEVGSVLSNLIG